MELRYPPSYVLDEMKFYEVNAALRYSHYAYKDSWEQARLIAYFIAQTNSTKRLDIEDVIKFYWEKEEKHTSISKEEIERLKRQAAQYIKASNNKEIREI